MQPCLTEHGLLQWGCPGWGRLCWVWELLSEPRFLAAAQLDLLPTVSRLAPCWAGGCQRQSCGSLSACRVTKARYAVSV